MATPANAATYTYDNLNRLTKVVYTNGDKVDYGYDAGGNILSAISTIIDPDSDNDGEPDSTDNCPAIPNIQQENNDLDSMGDVCDPDDDNDGFSDIFEDRFGSDPLVDTSLPQAYSDIAPGDPYHLATLGLDEAGVAVACDGVGHFCPDQLITRDTAAIWLIKAFEGKSYTPIPATGLLFADITTDTFAADYIEDLKLHSGTEGCDAGTPLPNYCPEQGLTKDQAAIMLLKTKYGAGYSPALANGLIYEDITTSTFAAGYIEDLKIIEVATEDCSESPPLYCPQEMLTRGGFAKMLAKTFGLMP